MMRLPLQINVVPSPHDALAHTLRTGGRGRHVGGAGAGAGRPPKACLGK